MYRTALCCCTAVVLLAAPKLQPAEYTYYTFTVTELVVNYFINTIFLTVIYLWQYNGYKNSSVMY